MLTILKRVNGVLRPRDWRRGGNTFYLRSADDWGVINIQSSLASTKASPVLTINAGVSLALLRRWQQPDTWRKKPHYSEAHWLRRIGELLRAGTDTWWQIPPTGHPDRESVIDDFVLKVTTVAAPDVEGHLSAEELRDVWLPGPYPFLSEVQRLSYLAVLLTYLGPTDRLPSVLRQLESLRLDPGLAEPAGEALRKLAPIVGGSKVRSALPPPSP